MGNLNNLAPLVELAKKRGIIFQSSEIYGGASGVYDFGPVGVELKNNLKKFFWKRFVHLPDNMFGIDAGILMQRAVWQASGHEMNFVDLMVECKKCHQRFRIDDEDLKDRENCPNCKGELTKPRKFNMMFKTFFGPLEDSGHQTFLRPETAQSMFVNFKNILDTSRAKIPFGMAQIGKAFRNEITTKSFIFRSREFEQGEIEFFIKPSEVEGKKWFDYWLKTFQQFFLDLGLSAKNMRLRQHKKSELAHYSKATVDIEYKFPWGWDELFGLANRTDYDLKHHGQISGKDLSYFDEGEKERYYPWVIEPSMGIDRTILAILCEGYGEYPQGRSGKGEKEIVLDVNPKIAAFKAAVFPLTKDEKLVKVSKNIVAELKDKVGNIFYDATASIGRRYRRQDEIGTPYCITVDFESLDDKKVTIRDIASMKQERVAIKDLVKWLEPKVKI